MSDKAGILKVLNSSLSLSLTKIFLLVIIIGIVLAKKSPPLSVFYYKCRFKSINFNFLKKYSENFIYIWYNVYIELVKGE